MPRPAPPALVQWVGNEWTVTLTEDGIEVDLDREIVNADVDALALAISSAKTAKRDGFASIPKAAS